MPPARPAASYLIYPFFTQRYQVSTTYQDIDKELWLTLRHPMEVPEAGEQLLHAHDPSRTLGTPQMAELWRELRAYLRQAENFYRGAQVLDWKSSPLNYYYAFLNLAKAYCLLAGNLPTPTAGQPRRVKHGLTERIVTGTPDVWQLTVQTSAPDLFPRFYQLSLGSPIAANVTVDAHDLLGYSLPIGWQLNESGYGARVLSFVCKTAVRINAGQTEAWDVIAIPRHAPFHLVSPKFLTLYQEVDHDSIKEFALEAWNLRAADASSYRFFEPIHPIGPVPGGAGFVLTPLHATLQQALPNAVFDFLAGVDHQVLLCLSCPTGAPPARIPMNQEVASYAVIFFLSSLIRYHPDYMDTIAQSSDAWLIESFVMSAPIELLRSLTSKILGYSLVMIRS